jgi:hypothetical protein
MRGLAAVPALSDTERNQAPEREFLQHTFDLQLLRDPSRRSNDGALFGTVSMGARNTS